MNRHRRYKLEQTARSLAKQKRIRAALARALAISMAAAADSHLRVILGTPAENFGSRARKSAAVVDFTTRSLQGILGILQDVKT